jgi:hypothetical protein
MLHEKNHSRFVLYGSLLNFLVFQTKNYNKKNQIWTRAKNTPYDFEQIDFNMSSVITVVFFTSKTKTIWLVILTNEKRTVWLVKLFK